MNDIVTKEPSVAPASPVTPMHLLQLATAQGADLEKLEKLMALQERWEQNEARKAYNRAFADFKAEAVSIVRNKMVTDGPLRGKSYAELFAVVDAVTPALSKHGLRASWRLTKDEPGWLEVTCTMTHTLGHSESVAMGGPPDAGGAKNSIQARASTVTYLERYTLLAATGLSARGQDDDARSAGGTSNAVEPDAEGKAKLEACGSLAALQATWKALTPEQRKSLADTKEECKQRIQEADKAAAAA
jgi:hypothetical protein